MINPDLRPIPIDLAELAHALNSRLDENGFYLDTRTGDLLFLPLDLHDYDGASEESIREEFGWQFTVEEEVVEAVRVVTDPKRFIAVEPVPTWQAFKVMEAFLKTVQQHELSSQLARALEGRKPFRRFRDALQNFESEQQRWDAFEAAAQKEQAVAWLAEHGLQPASPPEA